MKEIIAIVALATSVAWAGHECLLTEQDSQELEALIESLE